MALLNPFLNKVSYQFGKGQLRSFCMVLLVMVNIIPSVITTANPYSSDILSYITLYLITAYIKRYQIEPLNKRMFNILLLNVSLLFIMGTEIILDHFSPDKKGYFLYFLYYGYIYPVFLS